MVCEGLQHPQNVDAKSVLDRKFCPGQLFASGMCLKEPRIRDNIHRMSMQKLSWTDFFVQVSFLHMGMCLMEHFGGQPGHFDAQNELFGCQFGCSIVVLAAFSLVLLLYQTFVSLVS